MKIGSLIGVITICFSFSSYGQDEGKQKLTYKEALKIGMRNNVDYKTQSNILEARAAQRLQGYGNYLPFVGAEGFISRQDGLQIDPTSGSAINVTSDYIQGNINANYTIFNGFNRINTLRQNNNLFHAQNSLVKRAKQDIVFDVTSQYLQVLLDQDLLKIAAENFETQKIILQQIKGFVEVGSRAATDQYNQEALVSNAEVNYLRAKIALENDRALLLQTLQLDPLVEIEVTRSEWEVDIDSFNNLSLDSLYAIAENHREDLKQQNYMMEAASHTFRASASGYYPSLNFFASYGSTYFASDSWKSNPNIQRPESFRVQFQDRNPSLSYGLSLSIPIFDRFQARTNRISQRVAYENTILVRDNLLKTIKIDVQRTYKNYETAIQSYNASLVQYQAGELALATQKESYEVGIASQVELAQANQTYVQAASSRAQATATLFFQKMLLEYALGTTNLEKIIEE